MADKKVAAFGIYPSLTQASEASTRSCATASRTTTSQCSRPISRAPRTSRTRSTPRRRKARRLAWRPAERSVGRSGCSPASARWRFRAWALYRGGPNHGGVGRPRCRRRGRRVGRSARRHGIPEYEAKRYQGRVKDGGVLLSVHCSTSDEITRAKKILEQTGAEDISSSGEKTGETYATVAPDRTRL